MVCVMKIPRKRHCVVIMVEITGIESAMNEPLDAIKRSNLFGESTLRIGFSPVAFAFAFEVAFVLRE